jgi:branched-chain amino acid transport system permease protein
MAEYCGDIVETYIQDESVFKTKTIRIFVAILACCVSLLGLVASPYMVHLLVTICIAIIGAIGINIITGFTGMISIGHGAFVGLGAYATANFTDRLGIPFIISLPLSGLFASTVGILFGFPSLRIKGLYLLMTTFAAQIIINFLMNNWESLSKGVTGYPVGPASIGGFVFDSDIKYFYLVYVLALASILSATNIVRSRYGRAFVAIRDYDIAADIIGVNLFKYKTISFAVGSFYAGLAGALIAHYLRHITPEHFPIHLSIEYLAMIIVGGLGSIMGSIYGAIFVTLLPEFLKIMMEDYLADLIPGAVSLVPYVINFLFGTIIIAFLIFEPHGLAEIHRRIKKYFKLWPYAY